MTTREAALRLTEDMRSELRALLPGGAFLRVSRERLLFVTDAPARRPQAFDVQAVQRRGFRLEARDGLAFLGPDGERLSAWEAAFPDAPDPFCASLLRFRGRPVAEEALDAFALGLRLLALPEARAGERYDRIARQLAARRMRLGGCGGLYGCALLRNAFTQTDDTPY